MSTLAVEQPSLAAQSDLGDAVDPNDPFVSSTTNSSHLRFSHFDNQRFALGPNASPGQVQRALKAHIAETDRRIQDTSKLGTTLVQQRKDLEDRLDEVEQQKSEAGITPELRQKLEEIEREYNEVGRESARAFLPKPRVPSNEGPGGQYTGEPMRSVSPSKFESQATNSPSKVSVPNRKLRNQPSNRVHDIEFATEISTSLLQQVRHLQAALAEKDESLKIITHEKSRLEVEAEGFNQRLRSLDESEHRYKDENWNLETQIHEFLAAAKEAADREKKLSHSLHVSQTEKGATQKELDEIKLSHAKLTEDHAAAIKHHDVELGGVKRSMVMSENERGALQRKIDDLTGQNQELARAFAHQRGRLEDRDQTKGFSEEDFESAQDEVTSDHSPPPSPVKGTPRHSMLESETLKSSLGHAHGMIQNLKRTVHREKTEKNDLKRMLQEARDELENRRSDLGSGNGKRSRKVDSREFKKPLRPAQLGGLRNSKSEVFIEDPNWEEDDTEGSPTRSKATAEARLLSGIGAFPSSAQATDVSDQFDTGNEASDAFETANERGTETEDFQTGVEDMSGSDELTETEGGPGAKIRARPAHLSMLQAGNRESFQSTASASGDEYSYEDVKTPTAQHQRLRLKVGRGGNRRTRAISEEPSFQSSPASFANSSNSGTPQAPGQSLFAELGELSDEDDSFQGTPSRNTFISPIATPSSRPSTAKQSQFLQETALEVPKVPMVDSGMMTEPWEPEIVHDSVPESQPSTPLSAVPALAGGVLAGAAVTEGVHLLRDRPSTAGSQTTVQRTDSPDPDQPINKHLSIESSNHSRPVSSSTYSDQSSQYDPEVMDEKLARFPSPPTSRAHTPMASMSNLESMTLVPLSMSSIVSEHVEPTEPVPAVPDPTKQRPVTPKPAPPSLAFSAIETVDTEPIAPISPRSPRRDAFIMPREIPDDEGSKPEEPETPKGNNLIGSVFGWGKKKTPTTPIIAEDETRQSPSDSPLTETPESQRPFRELSNNTNERSPQRPRVVMNDESSQTALTAGEIDEILNRSRRQDEILSEDGQRAVGSPTRGVILPPALKNRKSQDSIGSVSRARAKMADPDFVHDTVSIKRPGSAGSNRKNSLSTHPPLPTDHKQVIALAAQRSGSSSGSPVTMNTATIGSMGPPMVPASAYRANPSFRPRTPSFQSPMSPGSSKGGPTPRAFNSAGAGDVYSPVNTGTGRFSRKSSVSSFTSEIETRFNMKSGVPVPQGLDPGTDPRMINAITQTMIGEYLWKYTRKAGRGAMSENRHRRYFWVHPYTRTLYWSDLDPSTGNRAENKAKSVPIEAVRVVTDDNPNPPGLHRKSLIVVTPGRSVKFTATTGQRHETWFNALSYLLLRTGEEAVGDSSELASGALTNEDVAEFNPGYANGSIRRGPGSLSSYNSRTTRNESPARRSVRMSMTAQPTLGQNTASSRPGTLSRLSNYWRPKDQDISSTQRSRNSISHNGSIYEASEVHDSAEDLRHIIEKQDRESDRLENVRACCDGKHDVGHLHSASMKGRHSQTVGAAAGPSRPGATSRTSRHSVTRRTE